MNQPASHISLVEEKVLDAEREGEAGDFVQPLPSNATANAGTTQLRQRAGAWAEDTEDTEDTAAQRGCFMTRRRVDENKSCKHTCFLQS